MFHFQRLWRDTLEMEQHYRASQKAEDKPPFDKSRNHYDCIRVSPDSFKKSFKTHSNQK